MAQRKKEDKKGSAPVVRKVVRLMWILFVLTVLGCVLLFYILSRSGIPGFELLENPKSNLATEVYSSDGRVLGRYYIENRVAVHYDELSPHLIRGLIATEDERFLRHSGVDFKALARVFSKTVLLGQRSSGGGSTISQQLAKLLFKRPRLSGNKVARMFQLVGIKLKEWITAVRLERSYTKEEIISMYLNHFNFIYGAYGVKAASDIYFGKDQKELKIEEAAMLIGMLKNPSLYNPRRFPDKAIKRREVVLYQMYRSEVIDKALYDSLRVLPLDMSNFRTQSHSKGPAPYFRQELTKFLNELFRQDKYKKPDGSRYNQYTDGLKVYTTIDLDLQKHAEAAVMSQMAKLQKRYWRVWRNRDPWTYDADSKEKQRRKRELAKLVRSSDRYAKLKASILDPVIERAKEETDNYLLKDFDIIRMLDEEKKSGSIRRLVARKIVSRSRAQLYKNLMKTEHWTLLKDAWQKLEKATEESFRKKVKMKVFAYDAPGYEKDTIMTPLDSIRYHRMHMQVGMLSIDPQTGQILSWVGGINHPYFKYDHIQSDRQVGSTFKPIVYATAITMQGISPCFKVEDKQYTISPGEGSFGILEEWQPGNAKEEFSHEKMSLYEGLKTSTNSISVFLMKQLGDAQLVRDLALAMGIDSNKKRFDGEYRVPRQPSICLGSADLTVMEMTSAYTTFANNGIHTKASFVTRIEDKNGKVLYRSIPEEQRALPENANYVMVDMLKYAQGPQAANRGIKSEFGGKTGTTNNYVDGWFIGISPKIVTGVWVGGEDRFIRFTTLSDGQGSRMARPIVHDFMKRIEADKALKWDVNARFKKPKGDLGIITDCEIYDKLNAELPVEAENQTPILEGEGLDDADDEFIDF